MEIISKRIKTAGGIVEILRVSNGIEVTIEESVVSSILIVKDNSSEEEMFDAVINLIKMLDDSGEKLFNKFDMCALYDHIKDMLLFDDDV